ncbi:MAG TPA: S9 family peptidase [Thermomicrobiales bacterium]|nr:S9 family peptidase [Thermomicrobiales bacterium]
MAAKKSKKVKKASSDHNEDSKKGKGKGKPRDKDKDKDTVMMKEADPLQAGQGEAGWRMAPSAVNAPPAVERHGRPLTIEDLYEFTLPGDPDLSPDRTRVAVAVTSIDRESDEYRSAIRLFSLIGDDPVQLTSGRWPDGSPRWSPDGRWLTFTSKRDDDAPQLWLLPTRGGEARQITHLDNGAADPVWAPDSRHLAFTSRVAPETANEESNVRVITSARYKFDGQGFLDDKVRHVWTIDALDDAAEPVQLTHGHFEHGSPAWSPSGREIAFIANRDAGWEMSAVSDVWTIPATGGDPRRLTDGKGTWRSLAWSPDGTTLAIAGNREVIGKVQNQRLFVVPAGGGELVALGDGIDRGLGDSSMSGPGGNIAGQPLRWTDDGRAIDALVSDRGSTAVVRFPVDGGAPRQLTGTNRHVSAFAHGRTGDELVITVADPTTPFELHHVTAEGEQPLSSFNAGWLAAVAVATPEEFWVESDGERIHGWLLRPAGNSSTSALVPLILNVHGGPHSQFSPAFFHELQLYAARGFALAYINPRGSLGYGEAFAQAVTGAWGETDAPDFLTAVDHVVGLGGIDGQRVGITGGSYGGFITNWMLGTTDRFTVGVTDRSISNMISMYGTDDISLVSLDPELGTPWDNFERYWEQSPLRYVANITAPLLIVHSENDYRCPMEQAEQLFLALKRLGRTTEFVRFPDESHGLSRNGKPKNRVERLQRTLGWFEKHL